MRVDSMKYLITCLIVAALTGCDQAPDVSQDPGSKTDAGAGQSPADSRQTTVQEGEPGKQATPGLPRGKATRYGLFRERGRGWVVQDEKASTGKLIRKPKLDFVEQTERIPLRKGTFFGYNYWLKIEPDQSRADLKRVLIHPEMTLPDGSKVSRSERNLRKRTRHGIVTSLDAYTLSEDYELVEGDWTFQLWYGDDLLVEQNFTTFWPEKAAEADAEDDN
ncbi:MAG: DUF3859 domain-containing protein [Pseudomonadota bacterium]